MGTAIMTAIYEKKKSDAYWSVLHFCVAGMVNNMNPFLCATVVSS